jgi:tripartite-type tricarboxylate transporter receptor subunit TctC
MKKTLLSLLAVVAACAVASCGGPGKQGEAPSSASGGSYPVQKLVFLCTSNAGGAMDSNTRYLAPYFEKYLGVPIEVRNMGGSAGWQGWKFLYDSPKDGSIVSYANFPNMITGYLDPSNTTGLKRENFEFLALYTSDTNVVFANKDEKRFKNGKEFFEYAKQNVVTLGTAGARSDDAVAVALMEQKLGFEFKRVHYQNSAEGNAAIMGGHIDALVGNVSEVVQLGGTVLPLVVVDKERSKSLPDIQCTYEIGLEVANSSSRGVICSKGIDPKAKEFLLAALKKAMEDPDQLAGAAKVGINVTPIYGADFEKWMAEQEKNVSGIFNLLDK